MKTYQKLAIVIAVILCMPFIIVGGVWLYLTSKSQAVASPTTLPASSQPAEIVEPAWQIGNAFPKVAPFAGIRWREASPEVQVNNVWYEWVAIDDLGVPSIIEAAQKFDAKSWQKRIDEDLYEVLSRMSHPVGKTVTLHLRNLDTHELVTLPNIAMTEANRRAIWEARNRTR